MHNFMHGWTSTKGGSYENRAHSIGEEMHLVKLMISRISRQEHPRPGAAGQPWVVCEVVPHPMEPGTQARTHIFAEVSFGQIPEPDLFHGFYLQNNYNNNKYRFLFVKLALHKIIRPTYTSRQNESLRLIEAKSFLSCIWSHCNTLKFNSWVSFISWRLINCVFIDQIHLEFSPYNKLLVLADLMNCPSTCFLNSTHQTAMTPRTFTASCCLWDALFVGYFRWALWHNISSYEWVGQLIWPSFIWILPDDYLYLKAKAEIKHNLYIRPNT